MATFLEGGASVLSFTSDAAFEPFRSWHLCDITRLCGYVRL